MSSTSDDDQSSKSYDSSSMSEEDASDTEGYDDFAQEGAIAAKPPEGSTTSKVMLATDILDYVDQVCEVYHSHYNDINWSVMQLIDSDKISSEKGTRLKRKYTALVESIET